MNLFEETEPSSFWDGIMSVLIDQSGKISVKQSVINKLLAPVEIGKFPISKAAKKFISDKLNEENTDHLFQFIPKDMQILCKEKKIIPTKASIFKKQAEDLSKTRSETSEIPHINAGEEIHFFFEGSYLIYFDINEHHYSLVVQEEDWLFIPAGVEHWIKATEDQYLLIASYHSEPFETFHSKVKYTHTKSRAFL